MCACVVAQAGGLSAGSRWLSGATPPVRCSDCVPHPGRMGIPDRRIAVGQECPTYVSRFNSASVVRTWSRLCLRFPDMLQPAQLVTSGCAQDPEQSSVRRRFRTLATSSGSNDARNLPIAHEARIFQRASATSLIGRPLLPRHRSRGRSGLVCDPWSYSRCWRLQS